MQAISREALPLPATPKGVTTYGQRNGLLFMLKGPRLKTVSYRTLGFPEYGMANASNFTRGFTPASNPERGNIIWATKWAFMYVKRAQAKNSVISYLRVPRVRNYIWIGLTKSPKAPRVKPRVRNDQCKQFYKRYLSPARNPK